MQWHQIIENAQYKLQQKVGEGGEKEIIRVGYG